MTDRSPKDPASSDGAEQSNFILKLSVTLSADRDAVDPVVRSVMKVVRETECASGREDDIELALTEALAAGLAASPFIGAAPACEAAWAPAAKARRVRRLRNLVM